MKKYEFHPIANVFPMLDAEGMAELLHDVEENGILIPIVLYEGKILDGRNRYRAAELTKLRSVPVKEYAGDDPIGFVASANLQRRHLTTSQRAAIAAELANMQSGVKRGKQQNNEGRSKDAPSSVSQADAAKKMNVSRKSVQRAAKVKKASPKTFKKVKEGKMSLGAAEKEVAPQNNNNVVSFDDAQRVRRATELAGELRNVITGIKDVQKRRRSIKLVDKVMKHLYIEMRKLEEEQAS